VLLDGYHRYTICQRHEISFAIVEAPVWVKTREEAAIWIIQNQLGRRNLEDYQRIELAERLRPLLEQRAKAKQRAGGREKVPQTFAEPGETRQAIADMARVSRETVRKAEIIIQEADEPTKQVLRAGERSIQSVYHELRPPRLLPSSTVMGERSSPHPPLVPPSRRIGPDASVYQHAPAARVTVCPSGHETAETAVASPPRSEGPSPHQEDLGTSAHRCLTLMGELYAELRTMEDLHDMIYICQVSSQQASAVYLQQCTYLISTLQVMQQALQTTVADAQPLLGGVERCREADPSSDGSGTHDELIGDGRTSPPLVFEGARVTATMALEARRELEGDTRRSPAMDAKPTEPRDVSHAAIDPTVPMPLVEAKASAEAACGERARQALVERIVATFPGGVPPRRDEVSTFVKRLNDEAFPRPHGARTWHMAAMWQQLRALGYPTSSPRRKRS
jgi:hypothetical protein